MGGKGEGNASSKMITVRETNRRVDFDHEQRRELHVFIDLLSKYGGDLRLSAKRHTCNAHFSSEYAEAGPIISVLNTCRLSCVPSNKNERAASAEARVADTASLPIQKLRAINAAVAFRGTCCDAAHF